MVPDSRTTHIKILLPLADHVSHSLVFVWHHAHLPIASRRVTRDLLPSLRFPCRTKCTTGRSFGQFRRSSCVLFELCGPIGTRSSNQLSVFIDDVLPKLAHLV